MASAVVAGWKFQLNIIVIRIVAFSINNPLRFKSIYVDDDHQAIYIADCSNHRIVERTYGAKNGEIVVGGNGIDQLNSPTHVIVDKKNDPLIICDQGNRRLVRWSHQNGKNGETIISDIHCSRLTMDKNGDLNVSDEKKNEVRRWKHGENDGTIVVGGNGQGNRLSQLYYPTYIFVDEDHLIYVSDRLNHRVMKGAKEGIVVAAGKGRGNSLTQLSNPQGVIVDHLGCCEGSIVVGGNGKGDEPNQFNHLRGLSFDVQGNIYVVDGFNHQIQKFEIHLN
ncbi:unnamed protein product [Adineta steineri]|uniref:Uncharacterized protein n=1 Tax=Adineta steineri TaxID=433720 RepID=A0A813QSY0_9BILA|nr:unnamed protein product [Adineta steineri]CAF3726068.1 unnamed protein product [Adineta steineri]